jgi:hypothetical protein
LVPQSVRIALKPRDYTRLITLGAFRDITKQLR